MAENNLQSLTINDLRCIIRRWGVKNADDLVKSEIIELIEEIVEERKSDHRDNNNEIMKLKGKKYDILEFFYHEQAVKTSCTVPDIYMENSIHLLLRDPFWVFAYWNVNPLEMENLAGSCPEHELILRVYELEENSSPLSSAVSFFDIPVKKSDRSWYINLSVLDTWYKAALIAVTPEKMTKLCVSNSVFSPGGYWAHHVKELNADKRSLELFFAGTTDHTGHTEDSTVVRKILDELEQEWKGRDHE